jgi:hypothetical protein
MNSCNTWTVSIWAVAIWTVAIWTVAIWTVAIWTVAIWTVAIWTIEIWTVAIWTIAIWTVAIWTVAIWTVAIWTVAIKQLQLKQLTSTHFCVTFLRFGLQEIVFVYLAPETSISGERNFHTKTKEKRKLLANEIVSGRPKKVRRTKKKVFLEKLIPQSVFRVLTQWFINPFHMTKPIFIVRANTVVKMSLREM